MNPHLSPWLVLRAQPLSYPLWQQLAGPYPQDLWPWHAQYLNTQAYRSAQAQGQTRTNPERWADRGCWSGPPGVFAQSHPSWQAGDLSRPK